MLWVLCSGAWAAQTTYECRAQQRNYATEVFSNFQNMIQSQMTFAVDEFAGTVTVWDPLIESTFGGPIPGTLTSDADNRLTVNWDIFVRGFNLTQARMNFRASLIKDTNKLIVTAVPLGFQERFFARGGCVVTSGG